MATDTRTRIEERTLAAQEHMRHQNPLHRIVSRTGLAAANTLDWLTGWGTNDRMVFADASVFGAMRGAVYGGLLALLAIACIPVATYTAFMGGALFLGMAGAGALYYGIHDGQKQLEKHISSEPWRLSDAIARQTDAVGRPPGEKTVTQQSFSWAEHVLNERTKKIVQHHQPHEIGRARKAPRIKPANDEKHVVEQQEPQGGMEL